MLHHHQTHKQKDGHIYTLNVTYSDVIYGVPLYYIKVLSIP